MTPKAEALALQMALLEKADVTEAYISFIRRYNKNFAAGIKDMEDSGYTEYAGDGFLTDDGRRVIPLYGKRWIRDKRIHDEEVERMLAEARNADAAKRAAMEKDAAHVTAHDGRIYIKEDTGVPTASSCPRCAEQMIEMSLCGKCDAAKLGYKYAYVCSCGVELFSREKL